MPLLTRVSCNWLAPESPVVPGKQDELHGHCYHLCLVTPAMEQAAHCWRESEVSLRTLACKCMDSMLLHAADHDLAQTTACRP